jgi:hypothetical protein
MGAPLPFLGLEELPAAVALLDELEALERRGLIVIGPAGQGLEPCYMITGLGREALRAAKLEP